MPGKLSSPTWFDFQLLWLLVGISIAAIFAVRWAAFLQVLLLEEIILILLELLVRGYTRLYWTKEMPSVVDVVVGAKIALEALAVEILIEVDTEEALEAVDRSFLSTVVMWSEACHRGIELIRARKAHSWWAEVQPEVLWWIFVPRGWPLLARSGLNRPRVASLPCVPPRIVLLCGCRRPLSSWACTELLHIRALLLETALLQLLLHVVLLMERVLPDLLVLRVEAIEVVVSLVEEVDHSRPIATAARCGSWSHLTLLQAQLVAATWS